VVEAKYQSGKATRADLYGQAVAEIARMYPVAEASAAGSVVGVGLLWGDRPAGV
jgi:hypothetical protein